MKRCLFSVSLLLVLLAGQFCFAQNESEQANPDQIMEEAPLEPIPVSEIARQSNEAIVKITDIRQLLQPDPEVIKIDSLFIRFIKQVNIDKEEFEEKDLKQIPLRRLNELQDEWLGHRLKVEEWQQILESRIKIFESQAQVLNRLDTLWDLTRDTANREGYPEAVKQQVKSLLNDLKVVKKELQKQLELILTLQSKISQQAIMITDISINLSSAIQEAQIRIFEADSAPIWKIFEDKEQDLSVADQIHRTQRKRTAILKDFFDNNYERILIHASIFIILLIVLFYFKKNIKAFRPDEQDQDLKISLHILRRPISTALLITLLMTRVLYPQAPDDLYKLNGIVGLIPIVRILIGIIPRDIRLSVYGLIFLYLVEKIYEIPYEHPLIPRLILVVLSGLTLLGLIWLTKSKRPSIDRKWGKGWKWTRLVAQIGIILLVISLLANIFGFVGLSSLLTSAFLKSIYLAVAFLTSVIVLDGLFSIMLRARILQNLHMVRVHSENLKASFRRILTFTAYIIWFLWTLSNFNLYDPIIGGILYILSKSWTLGNFTVSLGDIIAFAVAVWLSLKISKFIRFILNEDVLPRIELPRGVAGSISMLVHYMILSFGFIIAMAVAGIEWSRFAILAGALGVGIGFGLQNVVNNFVSGLVLIFERPIKVGDTIEVGQLIGTVKRIGIRSSTVRTYTGAEIIVPNGNLISNEVINWTLSDQLRRIDIAIGVAYGTDPKRVVKILQDVATEHDQVLKDPAPLVLFKGFGDSSLDFELRFWTANFDTWLRLKSEITIQVEAAIKKANIEIPFPQRDLHLRSIDPKIQK